MLVGKNGRFPESLCCACGLRWRVCLGEASPWPMCVCGFMEECWQAQQVLINHRLPVNSDKLQLTSPSWQLMKRQANTLTDRPLGISRCWKWYSWINLEIVKAAKVKLTGQHVFLLPHRVLQLSASLHVCWQVVVRPLTDVVPSSLSFTGCYIWRSQSQDVWVLLRNMPPNGPGVWHRYTTQIGIPLQWFTQLP